MNTDKKAAYVLFALVILLSAVLVLSTAGCTEQERAKNFGGTATIDLPAGEKLVIVTWKESDLWYLTRPREANEKPITYTFKESSSLGFASGTVIFVEH